MEEKKGTGSVGKNKLKILSILQSIFIYKSLDSRLDIPVLMAQLGRSCISRLIIYFSQIWKSKMYLRAFWQAKASERFILPCLLLNLCSWNNLHECNGSLQAYVLKNYSFALPYWWGLLPRKELYAHVPLLNWAIDINSYACKSLPN